MARRGYDKERRAVEMNGKAFFQVTRNEARPFSSENEPNGSYGTGNKSP